MKSSLNQDLSAKQLLMLTMTFYFLSFLAENGGDLIMGSLSVLGLICFVLFVIAFFRDLKNKTEYLLKDIFLIAIGYGFFLSVVYGAIKGL